MDVTTRRYCPLCGEGYPAADAPGRCPTCNKTLRSGPPVARAARPAPAVVWIAVAALIVLIAISFVPLAPGWLLASRRLEILIEDLRLIAEVLLAGCVLALGIEAGIRRSRT